MGKYKMKKFLLLILSFVLALFVFVGCGETTEEQYEEVETEYRARRIQLFFGGSYRDTRQFIDAAFCVNGEKIKNPFEKDGFCVI